MDLLKSSIVQIRNQIKEKKISVKEVASFFISRIQKYDSQLNSYISLNENILAEADALDVKLSRGEALGPLGGIPFGIKDMLCVKGMRCTAGSKILEKFVPPYDSTVVERLKGAGAIVLGKLNQDEFAMGSSNETSYFGPCKNPWNPDYVSGGSSGGSAAAQAARLAAGTIGTDTGGSIRQPASFCGVVGVKPTYGRVSRYGIVAYASSLDQAGPMASCVSDAALVLEVISGHDPKDGTTCQRSVPQFSDCLSSNIKGMKIGILKEFLSSSGVHEDVKKTIDSALFELKKMGAEIMEVSVPLTHQSIPMYYLIAASEASSNLARYDGVKYGHRKDFKNIESLSLDDFYSETRGEGFGSEVKRRIIIGTYCLSSGYYDAYYKKASQVRRLLTNQYIGVFSQCDVILSPVTATPAFKIGERVSDPLAMYLNDIFTTSTNLAGLPGMSVPFGLSTTGLPIGVQLTSGHFHEQKMLNVAYALESISSLKGSFPNVI